MHITSLSVQQWTNLAGAGLAVLIGILDLWVFGSKLTGSTDLLLIGTGLGTLLGTGGPIALAAAAPAPAAAAAAPTTPPGGPHV